MCPSGPGPLKQPSSAPGSVVGGQPPSPQSRVESEFHKRLTRSQSSRVVHGFAPSADLRNSEVLGMLRQEVDRTHDTVRRNSVKISERLILNGFEGGGGG